jgi:hypothetical protein
LAVKVKRKEKAKGRDSVESFDWEMINLVTIKKKWRGFSLFNWFLSREGGPFLPSLAIVRIHQFRAHNLVKPMREYYYTYSRSTTFPSTLDYDLGDHLSWLRGQPVTGL